MNTSRGIGVHLLGTIITNMPKNAAIIPLFFIINLKNRWHPQGMSAIFQFIGLLEHGDYRRNRDISYYADQLCVTTKSAIKRGQSDARVRPFCLNI